MHYAFPMHLAGHFISTFSRDAQFSKRSRSSILKLYFINDLGVYSRATALPFVAGGGHADALAVTAGDSSKTSNNAFYAAQAA